MLAVASEEAEAAQRAIDEHWKSGLDEQARAAADASIDLDAEVWNCPACTAAFPRGSARCPECGLRFG
ncbi:MAG TPA: hypothetical protein ENJ09_10065 [Planctomycetes bacterium]|nr:hypothetical protein [Planctomycetota bacterium]